MQPNELPRVWKFEFGVWETVFSLEMPFGAKILGAQEQANPPQKGHPVCALWALVNPEAILLKRLFLLVETGQVVIAPPERLQFVATVQTEGGLKVYHLFEVVGGDALEIEGVDDAQRRVRILQAIFEFGNKLTELNAETLQHYRILRDEAYEKFSLDGEDGYNQRLKDYLDGEGRCRRPLLALKA